jgi:hypothetical protein
VFGQKVVLSVRLARGVKQARDVLVCEVKDRGTGVRVREDEDKDLFDGAAARLESSGTGLGLRVCKSLCEAMKCEELGYRPNPLPGGKGVRGSIFFFHLPLFETPPPDGDLSKEKSVLAVSHSKPAISSPVLSGHLAMAPFEFPVTSNFDILIVDDSLVNIKVRVMRD